MTNDLDCNRVQTNLGNLWNLGVITSGSDVASNGYVSVTINGVGVKLMTRA